MRLLLVHRALEHVARVARHRGADEMHVGTSWRKRCAASTNDRHVLELGAPAARQQRHDQLPGRQAQRRARLEPVGLERDQVGERMADVGDRHPGLFVQGRLEREHHEDAVHRARDAVHAPAAPGPYLRAHVVDRRDAGVLQLALDAEVELRGIDADVDVRALGEQRLGQPPPDPVISP